jgi:hypothetical protein
MFLIFVYKHLFEFILYYVVFCINLQYLKYKSLLHLQILIILFWIQKKIYTKAKTILSEINQ